MVLNLKYVVFNLRIVVFSPKYGDLTILEPRFYSKALWPCLN